MKKKRVRDSSKMSKMREKKNKEWKWREQKDKERSILTNLLKGYEYVTSTISAQLILIFPPRSPYLATHNHDTYRTILPPVPHSWCPALLPPRCGASAAQMPGKLRCHIPALAASSSLPSSPSPCHTLPWLIPTRPFPFPLHFRGLW